MRAEANVSQAAPLRSPKSAHSGCLRGLWAQLNLPRGRPDEARRSAGSVQGAVPGLGGAAPAAPWRGERARLPRPRGRQRQRRGAGTARAPPNSAGTSTGCVPAPTQPGPLQPAQDGSKAGGLAARGLSSKSPPLRLRRSLALAAACICLACRLVPNKCIVCFSCQVRDTHLLSAFLL